MSQKQFALFQTRRFLPLFVAQFLGAFNDNAWKLFVIVLAGRSLVGMESGAADAEAQRQTML
ncbi:MAG: hypothetical protein QNL90_00965, partial [Gammaproteobacteria bacterium]|nr:hypothetical protein [Gammaproteobacteria bacterium]MDX2458630.1 hypothetical protein [Gammaproteobacteria bacterium]